MLRFINSPITKSHGMREAADALPPAHSVGAVEVPEVRNQTGIAHPIDVHVGRRLKAARTAAGLTQTDVADALGLKFQQIQKYESGYNRISASRLYEFSKLTGRTPGWFFEGADGEGPNGEGVNREGANATYPQPHNEPLRLSEWKLIMAFRTLPEDAQNALTKLIRMLSVG